MKSLALGLLLLAGTATASFSATHSLVPSTTRRRATTIQANEFDNWWRDRRARSVINNNQPVAAAPETVALDRDGLVLVFNEFVRSDFARQLCNHCNVEGTAYGQIGGRDHPGMFEEIRLIDGTANLRIKVKKAFDQSNEVLLDRLTKYLRGRIPQIKAIHVPTRDGENIY